MKKVFFIVMILLIMLVFVSGASDDDGDAGALGLALFLAGPIFYGAISAFYSGKGKRHDHEVATESFIDGLQVSDVFIRSIKGSRESSIGSVTYSNQRGIGKGAIANFSTKFANRM